MSSARRQKNTVQFGVRIENDLRNQLDKIAKYERAGTPSELVRTWIRLQVNSYRGNRAYLAWEAREATERQLEAKSA